MKTNAFLLFVSCLAMIAINHDAKAQTVTDYDGNVYQTVEIGEQTWMAENLKSEHFADGSLIVGTWIYDDDTANLDVYGRLYNWDAAMHYTTEPGTQGICPDGWHLPTDGEWSQLGTFLGGNSVAGGAMKVTGTEHWAAPNTGATNESGFSALGAGEIENNNFQFLHTAAVFWSSTQASSTKAKYRYLTNDDAALHPYTWLKALGYSIRCVKDVSTSSNDNHKNQNNIKLYPNPASRYLMMEAAEEGTYHIYAVSGKSMHTGILTSGHNKIDVSTLEQGFYILKTNIGSVASFIKN